MGWITFLVIENGWKWAKLNYQTLLAVEIFCPVFKFGRLRPGNCAAWQLLPAPRSRNKFRGLRTPSPRTSCCHFMNISATVPKYQDSSRHFGKMFLLLGYLFTCAQKMPSPRQRHWLDNVAYFSSPLPSLSIRSPLLRAMSVDWQKISPGGEEERKEVREGDSGSVHESEGDSVDMEGGCAELKFGKRSSSTGNMTVQIMYLDGFIGVEMLL